jgi:hypothetical protein
LLRFCLGSLGSVIAGFVMFRLAVFDPGRPMIQCVTVGILAAGILSSVRAGMPGAAVGLIALFGLVRLGGVSSLGLVGTLAATASALILGFGLLIIAVLYDLLARRGVRIGKFLLVGPMLAGLYLGLSPLNGIYAVTAVDPVSGWVFSIFLGLVIGDGVGLGVEITELFIDSSPRHEVKSRVDPSPADLAS